MQFPRHRYKKAWQWKDEKNFQAEKIFAEYMSRAKADPTNSYLTLMEEKETRKSSVGPLNGIPIGIKDNLVTKGTKTTCGSRVLENYIPPYDATVVQRLRDAGALFVGKCNMDEFAMGSSNENSAFGPVKLPQNHRFVPGGSSGGSAAAVAGNLAVMALGSDTGGSVRQPASFCGVVGLKPTYGRVSRYGLVAFASSLDQVGTLALDSQDSADLLETIAGFDEADSTSSSRAVPAFGQAVKNLKNDTSARQKFLQGLRIGIPKEYFSEGLSASVRAAVEKSLDSFRKGGAQIIPVSLPHSEYALAVYYVVAVSEASANLARFDGVRFGARVYPKGANTTLEEMYEATRGSLFGNEVKRRILLGTFTLSSGYYDAYYKRACQVRNLISLDFAKCFEQVDLLAGPTTPTCSFPLGEKTADPLSMYLSDVYTVPVNLAGLPAISAPCGLEGDLPLGIQFIAPAFQEQRLLEAVACLESFQDGGV